ncbi:unnamed protein product [Choristocarpus tenellus]
MLRFCIPQLTPFTQQLLRLEMDERVRRAMGKVPSPDVFAPSIFQTRGGVSKPRPAVPIGPSGVNKTFLLNTMMGLKSHNRREEEEDCWRQHRVQEEAKERVQRAMNGRRKNVGDRSTEEIPVNSLGGGRGPKHFPREIPRQQSPTNLTLTERKDRKEFRAQATGTEGESYDKESLRGKRQRSVVSVVGSDEVVGCVPTRNVRSPKEKKRKKERKDRRKRHSKEDIEDETRSSRKLKRGRGEVRPKGYGGQYRGDKMA